VCLTLFNLRGKTWCLTLIIGSESPVCKVHESRTLWYLSVSKLHTISGSMGRARRMDGATPGSLQPSRINRLNSSFVSADLSTCRILSPTSSLVICLFPSSSKWRFSNSVMYRTRQSRVGKMAHFSASYASCIDLLTVAAKLSHGVGRVEMIKENIPSIICLLSLGSLVVFLCGCVRTAGLSGPPHDLLYIQT
jgi:hypothetical protein